MRTWIIVGALLVAACGKDKDNDKDKVPTGGLNQPCRSDGTCDANLVCNNVADRCVELVQGNCDDFTFDCGSHGACDNSVDPAVCACDADYRAVDKGCVKSTYMPFGGTTPHLTLHGNILGTAIDFTADAAALADTGNLYILREYMAPGTDANNLDESGAFIKDIRV